MLKHMKSHKNLKPGENGTLRLVERFGDTLLCVRYRYDAIRDVRIKTAEINRRGETWERNAANQGDGYGPATDPIHNESTARSTERSWREVGPIAEALACAVGVDTWGQGVGRKGCEGMKKAFWKFPV